MLIFRYLVKEVLILMTAITTILLFILISNQVVLYLERTVDGQIPSISMMKLVILELPMMIGLLLPLSFYLALLLTYGRLYGDNEITVLHACGYGPRQLLRHSFMMASLLFLLMLIIMAWTSPAVSLERAKLLRAKGIQIFIKMIIPGHFHDGSQGHPVYYVESINHDHTIANEVFSAHQVEKNGHKHWTVLWAERAHTEIEPTTYEDHVILENGSAYEGQPGKADYQMAAFKRYKARLSHPEIEIENDIRTASTINLLPINNPNLSKVAELQWRISLPIMVLTLTLLVVPLSRIQARASRYAKLLPALILFFLYANFVFIARQWLEIGKTPPWLGIWWVHAIFALVGLTLIWRNHMKI